MWAETGKGDVLKYQEVFQSDQKQKIWRNQRNHPFHSQFPSKQPLKHPKPNKQHKIIQIRALTKTRDKILEKIPNCRVQTLERFRFPRGVHKERADFVVRVDELLQGVSRDFKEKRDFYVSLTVWKWGV